MPDKWFFIMFSVDMDRKKEIDEYLRRKKRWKTASDLARDAVAQLMDRYPIYRRKGEKRPENGE